MNMTEEPRSRSCSRQGATLRLLQGTGPVHLSGSYMIETELEDDEMNMTEFEAEEEKAAANKRKMSPPKAAKKTKKAKMEKTEKMDCSDEDEEEEDEEDDEEEEEEEEKPAKKAANKRNQQRRQ